MNILNRLLCAGLCLVCALPAHAALRVVATTQDLAALAQAVGGDDIRVQYLVPGTRDPHFVSARPSMIRKVYRADLLLAVGAGLEVGWLPALLESARNGAVQPGAPGYLDLSTTVGLLDVPRGPVTRAMGDVHAQGNPHYWLDPRRGLRMARAIAERLTQLDPAQAAGFAQRLAAFEAQMAEALPRWRTALTVLRDQPVISYHTSFRYLADAFGFRIAAQVEPKPGIAPSPAYLARLVQRIRREHIGLLIMEPYYERRSAQYLQAQTGIRVLILPQSVGALPGIETYFDLFERIVAELEKAEREIGQQAASR